MSEGEHVLISSKSIKTTSNKHIIATYLSTYEEPNWSKSGKIQIA